MIYIEDLKEDEHIVEHYLCKEKQSLKSRAGKTYYSLKLQDKTGVIEGKVWDLTKDIQSFEQNDFIKIDGLVLTYQNTLQLKINKIRKSDEGEYDPASYIPATDKNVDVLYTEILEFVESLNNKYIKELLNNILKNHPVISKALKTHSAAKSMHHSYMGGLIEHTLSVLQICDFLSGKYKFVNRDILLAGAILHDICKIYELSPFPENDYTDDGQLLGHLVMGAELVNEECGKIPGFPHELSSLIKHCILSHHGSLEYGSPKLPATIEAAILSHADSLDAKMQMFETSLENNNTKSNWVGYNRVLGTNVRSSDFNA